MIGGLLKSTSRLAIIAAAGMFVGGLALTPAQAADLGGDCCADLEERVADLEATTARKGNRKVSLKISGHVARDFGWYEDEDGNSELYSAGHGVSGSRVLFSGSAKLTSSWTAGYVLRLRFNGDRTSDVLDDAGGRGAGTIAQDRNYVYLKNDGLGTIVLGETGAPTDGVANISLGGRGVTGDSAGVDWNASDIQGFDLEQGTHQAIAYISPTIAGFTLAVAWADLDDDAIGSAGVDAFDMALRYANEFGPIRIAAGIGYTTVDHDTNSAGANVDGANVMGSVALMHTPTGLNVSFGAGKEVDGGLLSSTTAGASSSTVIASAGALDGADCAAAGNCEVSVTAGAAADTSDRQFWHVAGGISQNFFGPGKTSVYGEYGNYDNDNAALVDDTVEMWGLGVVQNFDSAATELYLAYRNWDQNGVGTDGEVSQVMAGMRIKF